MDARLGPSLTGRPFFRSALREMTAEATVEHGSISMADLKN
jgi:hypothetical protein